MSSRRITRSAAAAAAANNNNNNGASSSSSSSSPNCGPANSAPGESSGQPAVEQPPEPNVDNSPASVLSRIWCPFQETRICVKNKLLPNCPFGHLEDSKVPPFESDLTDLPSYACAHYLMNRCPNEARKRRNSLRSCVNGLHLETSHLRNLAEFEEKYSAEIARFHGANYKLECSVCLEQILTMPLDLRDWPNRRFGVLDTCSHAFCARCILNSILAKLTDDPSVDPVCPVCRQPLNEISIQRAFPKSDNEKLQLFLPTITSFATVRRSMLDGWIRAKRPAHNPNQHYARGFIFRYETSDDSDTDRGGESDDSDDSDHGYQLRRVFHDFFHMINEL